VVHEQQGVIVTRLSRITSLALAIAAAAVPTASAAGPDRVTPDARDAGRPVVIDRVSPDARDAGRPVVIDRVSPDARDNGRREPAPVVVSSPPVVAADGFDWLDAGLGAVALAVLSVAGFGAATTLRTRRSARTA
jgi:hypothetical protein